jgi:hypothetical protein
MARKFPNADIVGIDIAPVPIAPENVPPNCHFELDDIQLGLTHFHGSSNQFDLIHVQFISAGLRDFYKALRDVMMCLKPGGLLIWIAADYEGISSETYDILPVGSDMCPNGSWIGRFFLGESMRRVVIAIKRSHKRHATIETFFICRYLDAVVC